MTTERISLCCLERNIVIEVDVTPEDAKRAEKDLLFATELMEVALRSQSKPCSSASLDVTYSNEEITNTEADCQESETSLYRWSTPCVLLLLETYKSMETRFYKGKSSQKKLWSEVADKLVEKGYNITGPQCAFKMRSLKKTYKVTKDHNNKSGNDRQNWQFFETCKIMDEIFSKKAWCNPVSVASSTCFSGKNKDANIVGDSDSGCSSKSVKSKTSLISLLGKRIKQKEEHEENKAKRHKERMEIDKQFIELLEKLVEK